MTEPTTTKRKKAKAEETAVALTAYKGFGPDLSCRGHKFEVGKSYVHTGPVVQCESGFHACQSPLDVLDYYPLIGITGTLNRFARVTVGGKIDRSDDKKWASAEITINAELTLPEFIKAGIDWIMSAAKGDGATVSKKREDRLAASGYSSKLAASGDSSKLAASGYSSQLAASGNSSQLAASGNSSKLAASGYSSQLAASGYSSQLEITGAKSVAAAVGRNSAVKAVAGTPIAICEYGSDGTPIGFATGIAGKDGVPADTWLIARNGKLEEA